MSTHIDPTTGKLDEAARAYGEGITDLARELGLDSETCFVIFGMFARKLIDVAIARGASEQELLESACNAFSRGLGITFAGLHRKQ
jgi:hypothetical protein